MKSFPLCVLPFFFLSLMSLGLHGQSALQSQEDVRNQTVEVREAIAGVLEELKSVGVDAQTLVAAQKMLVELETASEREMPEAIRLIRDRGDSASLVQAVGIQGKTSQRLQRLADLLEARQSFEGMGARLRGLLQRQTENRQRTELLAGSEGGGKTMRMKRAELNQLALGQQELIADELKELGASLPRYAQGLTGEARKSASELVKIYSSSRPGELAIEAFSKLREENPGKSAEIQTLLQKALADMLALVGGEGDQDLSRAAALLAELAGRQSALADTTAAASGREKAEELAAEQADLAKETEMLQQTLAGSQGEPPPAAASALAAMQAAQEALAQRKPDFAGAAGNQIAAAEALEAAAEAASTAAAAEASSAARMAAANDAAELSALAKAAEELARAQAAAEKTSPPQPASPVAPESSAPASSAAAAAAEQRATAAEQLAEAAAEAAPDAAAGLAQAAAEIRDNQSAAGSLEKAAKQLSAAAAQAASSQQAAQAASAAAQALDRAQEQTAAASQAMQSGQSNASAEASAELSNAAQSISQAASAPGLPQEAAAAMSVAREALQQAARHAGQNLPSAPQAASQAAQALAAAERELSDATGQAPPGQTAGGPPPPSGQRPPVPGAEGGTGTGGQGTGIAEAASPGAISEIPGFDPGTPVPNAGVDLSRLDAHQREALAALQRETTPPDYSAATRQYFRNLAGESR